jgi:hypothetical protein
MRVISIRVQKNLCQSGRVKEEPEQNPGSRAQLAQLKRLELIDFRLAWERRVNRSDLTSTYGVSIPQATLDFARYQELHPKNAEYDRSAKEYVPQRTFAPAYDTSSIDSLLKLSRDRSSGCEVSPSPAGWLPAVESVPLPRMRRPEQILRAIIDAMRGESGIEISYQSMTSPSARVRTITPHTLIETSGRWHVRAYCHKRDEFRDFVLSRVGATHAQKPSGKSKSLDADWNALTELHLVPLPELHPDQRAAVAEDYEMEDGLLRLSCRRALTFYTLLTLGVEEWPSGRVISRRLELTNASQLTSKLVPKRDWFERLQAEGRQSE